MQIKSIKATQVIQSQGSQGDTWNLAWSREGDLYSPVNDGWGFVRNHTAADKFPDQFPNTEPPHHLLFAKIPQNYEGRPYIFGHNVSAMDDYHVPGVVWDKEPTLEERLNQQCGPDKATWKTSGCTAIDGTLYLVVGRHKYGDICYDDPFRRQRATNASIIKSTDGGKTWTRSAKENYDNPMFPGQRFSTPYFLDYGQDGNETFAHGGDKYVYAHANGGYWDNSDDMVLGRVLRSKIGKLDPADWQYFTGGDGMNDSAWSPNMADAKPVIETNNKLGSTGAVYLPHWKSYCLIGWYFPTGGGKLPGHEHTIWDFHVAPTPWGPWRVVGHHSFAPEAYYCPAICPRFNSPDGKTVWAATSGDWCVAKHYKLSMVRLEIE